MVINAGALAVGMRPQSRVSRHLDGLSFEYNEAVDLVLLSGKFCVQWLETLFLQLYCCSHAT